MDTAFSYLHQAVTQSMFGDLVGIGQPAVSELLKREVITDGDTAHQWLLAYCANLRKHAAGRAAAGYLDLGAERAALARAQRERIEMQNGVTRSELAPVALIEEVLSKAGARIGGIFDAIPGAVRRRVPSLSSDEIGNIEKEIARARNIVAAISLADLRGEDVVEDEESGESHQNMSDIE